MAILLSAALAGCSRSPTEQTKLAKTPEVTEQKTIDSTAGGKWSLHRGKAVDTLILTETGGVITGSITLDPAWGGKTFSLHGMRVSQEVEMFYASETTSEDSDNYRTTADYSFKGTIEANKMTGKCKVSTISFFKSGRVIPISDEILWIAERQSEKK